MIFGIGTDIIEIKRIDKAVKDTPKFLEKAFTEKEIEMFKKKNYKVETIAGNFAAKEAISKALGTGIRGFGLRDIEVLRDGSGKPEATISNIIKERVNIDKYKIHLSISHDKSSAIAFVVLEI